MQQFTKCPCCNDNEHGEVPSHDIMMTQALIETGAISYLAMYYYCPITDELYEDEDMQNEHMQMVENIIKESTNGTGNDRG